jgi:predicted metal-dependent phosphoesterase TrpH
MTARLAALGMPIDLEAVLARQGAHAVGRPAIADALVRAGYVATRTEAFDRFLGNDGAAFVPRQGAAVAAVVGVIREAGGLASIAHPGLHRDLALIERLVDGDGAPDAIEVFHTDHDAAATARLLDLAERAGILVTGGSDFHGDAAGRPVGLGRINLPADRFERFAAKARPS